MLPFYSGEILMKYNIWYFCKGGGPKMMGFGNRPIVSTEFGEIVFILVHFGNMNTGGHFLFWQLSNGCYEIIRAKIGSHTHWGSSFAIPPNKNGSSKSNSLTKLSSFLPYQGIWSYPYQRLFRYVGGYVVYKDGLGKWCKILNLDIKRGTESFPHKNHKNFLFPLAHHRKFRDWGWLSSSILTCRCL